MKCRDCAHCASVVYTIPDNAVWRNAAGEVVHPTNAVVSLSVCGNRVVDNSAERRCGGYVCARAIARSGK